MIRTEIKGKLKNTIKGKLFSIKAKKAMVDTLSKMIMKEEEALWKLLRKEFPESSNDCSLKESKKGIFHTDRLGASREQLEEKIILKKLRKGINEVKDELNNGDDVKTTRES